MIYPSIDEITKGKYNRYTLCIATAKCARIVTDEYTEQRELAEKMLANKETDKSLASMIKKEIRDEKAVKTAIKRLYNGDFEIKESTLNCDGAEPVDILEAEENRKAEEAAKATIEKERAEQSEAQSEQPVEASDTDAPAVSSQPEKKDDINGSSDDRNTEDGEKQQ